jgi:hypothetical protein
MTTLTAPNWLTLRDGSLKRGLSDTTLLVILSGQPQYRLDVRPAGGQFMCAVTQTNNGKRLDGSATFDSPAAALAGGLDELRQKLGW